MNQKLIVTTVAGVRERTVSQTFPDRDTFFRDEIGQKYVVTAVKLWGKKVNYAQ